MRRLNSVGGYRIEPGPPELRDAMQDMHNMVGRFNDGVDQVRRHRGLSQAQDTFLQQSAPESLRIRHQRLATNSQRIWELAMHNQRYLAGETLDPGPYTTHDVGSLLLQCAQHWQELKDEIQSQMRSSGEASGSR